MGREELGARRNLNIPKESKSEDESRDRKATERIKGENEKFEAPPLDISKAILRIKIPAEYGAGKMKHWETELPKLCRSCSYTKPGIKTSQSMWR